MGFLKELELALQWLPLLEVLAGEASEVKTLAVGQTASIQPVTVGKYVVEGSTDANGASQPFQIRRAS